jgi:hypothetical protein
VRLRFPFLSVSPLLTLSPFLRNPDKRVELVKNFAFANFPSTTMLEYALAVEDVTSAKKDTLILNVDGAIAVLFCDLLKNSGAFTAEEATEYLKVRLFFPFHSFFAIQLPLPHVMTFSAQRTLTPRS